MALEVGIVKWFNQEKGYGFIEPSNGGPDLFTHISRVWGTLTEGQHVEYEVGIGRNGKTIGR